MAEDSHPTIEDAIRTLRLASAAYGEMIGADDDTAMEELHRRQERAEAAFERYQAIIRPGD